MNIKIDNIDKEINIIDILTYNNSNYLLYKIHEQILISKIFEDGEKIELQNLNSDEIKYFFEKNK